MNSALSLNILGKSFRECASLAVLAGGRTLAEQIQTVAHNIPINVFRNIAFGLVTPASVHKLATNGIPNSSADFANVMVLRLVWKMRVLMMTKDRRVTSVSAYDMQGQSIKANLSLKCSSQIPETSFEHLNSHDERIQTRTFQHE